MKSIIIFASGNGTNAQSIISYLRNSGVAISLVCNRSDAKVLDVARNCGIDYEVISKAQLESGYVLSQLVQSNPNLIVLAGFLLKMPKEITDRFRVVNIHPSLLPKFGGKGMHGINVHRAVIESGEKESGITVHWVDENYDEGAIIAQFRCEVGQSDKPEELAAKIHMLELKNFPEIVFDLLNQ